MGRGEGNRDRALRLRAIPRRLARPKSAGQRRYTIYQASSSKGVDDVREPGYLRIASQKTPPFGPRSLLTLQEEIAVISSGGGLVWISANNGQPVISHKLYSGGTGVGSYRFLADSLNDKPLGPYLEREVDKNGNIVIRRGCRRLSSKSYVHAPDSPEQIEAGVEAEQTFPVSRAAQAKAYYQEQQKLYQAAVESEIAKAIAALPTYEREGYFESEAAAELGQCSRELADSLDEPRRED